MARPRQWTNDAILEAARLCFLEQGPSVSTQVIADSLGMSQAAIFKRFGTKEELLVAALAPPAKVPWLHLVEDGPDARPVREQLVEITVAIGRFFEELVPRMMMLASSGHKPVDLFKRYDVPPPVRAQLELAQWFERAIAQGRTRPVDSTAAANLLLGALHARVFQRSILRLPVGADALQDHAEAVVDVLWRGVAPVEAE